MSWLNSIDTALPYWQDCLPILKQLDPEVFPDCKQLNALLPDGLISGGGQAIHFVKSSDLGDDAYEHRIYTTGQISTRPDNWHDLFNALIWMQFPHIKTAMNRLHYNALSQQSEGSRGPLRDALTLFDECGVIVFSKRFDVLSLLAERDWSTAYQSDAFNSDVKLAISGHAMLEKYLSPYKSITAKALYVYVNEDFLKTCRQEQFAELDKDLATRLLSGELLSNPACLAPLPLAGVPGWWPQDPQDDSFYDDPMVFRAPTGGLTPVPIIGL
jgi:hypothetical protein